MARTKFSELRDTVVAKPGAIERLDALRPTRSKRYASMSYVTAKRSARWSWPASSCHPARCWRMLCAALTAR